MKLFFANCLSISVPRLQVPPYPGEEDEQQDGGREANAGEETANYI